MKDVLEKLLQITEGCRENMHEPDEQGLSAKVFGSRLDNAFPTKGKFVNVHQDGELKVKLIREYDDEVESSYFNLADLIALARKAQLDTAEKNRDLLDALQAFVDAKGMAGWNEGNCDLFLGPIWHKAQEAIRKAEEK